MIDAPPPLSKKMVRSPAAADPSHYKCTPFAGRQTRTKISFREKQMNCQHCNQKPAVLNDRHGILCAQCWMTINQSCRPDVAPTPGFEHGVTRRFEKEVPWQKP